MAQVGNLLLVSRASGTQHVNLWNPASYKSGNLQVGNLLLMVYYITPLAGPSSSLFVITLKPSVE